MISAFSSSIEKTIVLVFPASLKQFELAVGTGCTFFSASICSNLLPWRFSGLDGEMG